MKKTRASAVSRRRGGQELPDDVQDRPEQNAGYDAAVRGEGSGTPVDTQDDLSVVDLERNARDAGLNIEGEGAAADDEDGR